MPRGRLMPGQPGTISSGSCTRKSERMNPVARVRRVVVGSGDAAGE